MIDNLYFMGTIAAKDILDAIKNRFVLYQIIAISLILVSIKGLSFIIQPPATPIVVYDPSGSPITAILEDSPDFSLNPASSLAELQALISNMGFGLGPELGLEVPPGFTQEYEGGGQPVLEGYVSWANRSKAAALQHDMEAAMLDLTGEPVQVHLEGNIITPPGEIGLLVGIVTIFAMTIILNVGVILVPALLIEEKQNHTMEVLLVSPASIGQVVAGKALAGAFYILVTAAIVYLIYGAGVYNWGLAALFVVGAMLLAVSVGLLLGILFNRQQEITGWLSLSLVFVTGTIFMELLDLDLPAVIERLLPWMPPVALAKIFWASFSSQVDTLQVFYSFSVVVVFSGLIFGFIIWRVKQLDR